MKEMPRVPGCAVFMYSKSAGYITHVGYLWKPVKVGHPESDWYVIESRGVMFGVVATKLSERNWNRWGLMEKYFDYGATSTSEPVTDTTGETKRLLKIGCRGEDVKNLQMSLIDLGYSCGHYGADGDFGEKTRDAVKAFQIANALEADGIVGEKTWAKIAELMPHNGDPIDPTYGQILITGGMVNIRTSPSTSGKIMKVAKQGEKYPSANKSEHGWFAIYVNDEIGWVSGKYAEAM